MTGQVAPKKKAKWPWVVGVVALLVIVGQCDSDKGDKDKASSSSSTTTEVAAAQAVSPPETSPPAPPVPAGPTVPDGVDFHTEPGTSGEVLFAQFDISDNLTKGFIRRGAQYKTVEILKYADAVYPGVSKVFVQGSFPTTDAYGNTKTGIILNAGYDRATLDKINFDGIDSGKIWEIRDSGMVHPDLQG